MRWPAVLALPLLSCAHAGAALQVRTVAGRGHEWLLEGAEQALFLRWLAGLPPP